MILAVDVGNSNTTVGLFNGTGVFCVGGGLRPAGALW